MNKYLGLFATGVVCASLSFSAFAEGDVIDSIASNENVAIDLVSVNGDLSSEYSWTLRIENKMDQEIAFSTYKTAINNLIVSASCYENIPAGETVEATVTWPVDLLKEYGMTDITKVSFECDAYEKETYGNIIDANEYAYYPNGEEAFVKFERTPADSDITIIDNDMASVIIEKTGASENGWDLYSVNMYINNKSDHELYFRLEEPKMGGAECDPYWSEVLGGSTSKYTAISYSDYTLSSNGVESLGDITGTIVITDWTDYAEVASADINIAVDGTVTASAGSTELGGGDEPIYTEPVEPYAVDPVSNVKESGAEGKTWADIFAK